MLKFFNVVLNYENAQEIYTEPAKNIKEVLQNILLYELVSPLNNKQQILKHFKIIL